MPKKSVLVVDKDPFSSGALFEGLVRAGFTVTDSSRADFAAEILSKRSFDVAVVDALTSRVGDLDLIEELRKSWNDPLIIVTADFDSPAVQNALLKRGAHRFVKKPVDIQRLVEIISPPPVFSGQVAGVDILEYLQFMMLTGKNTIVVVEGQGTYVCRMYLNDGNIVHAVDDHGAGEEALYRCLKVGGGTFSNLPWEDPDTTTISKPGEFILIEAARKRDESG
jgi:CheY-like chemotaxis protein